MGIVFLRMVVVMSLFYSVAICAEVSEMAQALTNLDATSAIIEWRDGGRWRPGNDILKSCALSFDVPLSFSVPQRPQEARKTRAAAISYIYCTEGSRNPGFGLMLLAKLADAGDVDAKVELAQCYTDGLGVSRNFSTAKKILAPLLNEGIKSRAPLVMAAMLLSEGQGDLAVSYMRRGMEDRYGDAFSMYAHYIIGNKDAADDDLKRRYYDLLKKGADLGSLSSLVELQKCTEIGYGRSKDPIESEQLVVKTAKMGYPAAVLRLALQRTQFMKNGDEVVMDETEKLFKTLDGTDGLWPGEKEWLLAMMANRLGMSNKSIFYLLQSLDARKRAGALGDEHIDFLFRIDRLESNTADSVIRDYLGRHN